MVNVLLLGTVRPSGNKGDEAIYITTINLIRKHLPGSRIILAPSGFRISRIILKRYGADMIINHPMGYPFSLIAERVSHQCISEKVSKSVSYHVPSCISALLLKFLSGHYRKIYSDADLYVVLSFPFEKEGFPVYVSSCNIPQYFDPSKPLIIFPISISTKVLNDIYKMFVMKNSLSRASIVFTRGEYSSKILRESLNLKNVLTAFDPAILLAKSEPKLKPSGGIALTPAGLLRNPKILARLVNVLVEKLNMPCWIVPTSVYDLKEDFLSLVNNIHKHNVNVINTEIMSPSEIKGFLSYVDVLITARVHAAIFALSEDVPSIAILRRDDVKFYDVQGTFGLEHFIFDLSFNLKDSINNIVKSVNMILDRKKEFVSIIRKKKQYAVKRAEIPGLLLRMFLTC